MKYLVECNKGKRKIIRILLILLGFGCIILGPLFNWFIVIGIYLLVMVGFVKDLQLIIYTNRFEIKHISIIKTLSSIETFYFKDIQSIRFDKGFTNVIGVLIDSRGIFNTTHSKPDTIEVTLKDGSWRSINRIGLKRDFYNACEVIIEEMNKLNL